ncbi:MAG: hypothetical protein HY602_03255 [Parcubacteria group bacterium]|nr:hypothetical protein [Parcubacteria group bacterium]
MKKLKFRFPVATKIFLSVFVFGISLVVTGFFYKEVFTIQPMELGDDIPNITPTKQPVVSPTFAPEFEYKLSVKSASTLTPIPTSTFTNQLTKDRSNNLTGNIGGSDSGYGYPCDDRYATAGEIFEALNNYRNVHGAGSLAWNEKLAEVARMRVKQTLAGGRDYHQGFTDFTNDQDNYQKVGFWVLSENIGSSGDCPLLGVHLIEFKISRSPAHDAAQRDPSWIAVGIATEGGVTSFIFGRDPI